MVFIKYRGHPHFYEMLETMAEIHARKNADYATEEEPLSNLKMCERLGITEAEKGIMVRMTDKFSRLVELVAKKKEAQVYSEKVEDTCIDLAVYSLLLAIILKEKKEAEKT